MWCRMIKFNEKLGYGCCNFGYGLILQVITSYLVFYSTVILKIPGVMVGTMISISVIWDALSDPIMGYISDITKLKKFGRRHLYLIIGASGLAIFNAFIWKINPNMPMLQKFVLLFIELILLKTFMTIFITPYTALGAELTDDYNERTSIQAIKTAFFIIGLMFSTVIGMIVFFKPTKAYPIGQMNPDAYKYLGYTISILILICSGITIMSTKKFIPYLPKDIDNRREKFLKDLVTRYRYAFKNRDYVFVALAYLATNIASALIGTIGLHVFTYTFYMDNMEIGIIFGVQFLVSILSQAAWIKITKKLDKKNSAKVAVLISIIGSSIFALLVILKGLVRYNYIYLIPYAVFAGFGMGGLMTIPLSMIADTIDEEELKSSKRMEGIFYGGLTFSYKSSQAIAIFILGIVLEFTGFNPDKAVQPEHTVIILGLILALGSTFVFILSGLAYNRYSLTKEKVELIQKQIYIKKVEGQ